LDHLKLDGKCVAAVLDLVAGRIPIDLAAQSFGRSFKEWFWSKASHALRRWLCLRRRWLFRSSDRDDECCCGYKNHSRAADFRKPNHVRPPHFVSGLGFAPSNNDSTETFGIVTRLPNYATKTIFPLDVAICT